VVIYDRCYLDNVATLSLRGVPPWLLRALAAVWRSATFGLDRVICLEATPDELYRRRPETPRRQLERLRAAYSGLGSRWVAPLRSDSQALTRASRIVMSLSTPARPEVAAPAAPGAAPGCQQPGGTEPAGLFEEQWRARFERFARTYQNEALISGWSPEGLRRRLALFEALLPALGLPERCRALDLGCGGGSYVRLLAGLGHRVVGLDYSVPSLERARAADPGGKGRYLAGEAYALPVAGASLDLVVSIGVLQALGDPEAALAEMARVLRPGGVLVVEALNAGSAPDRLRRALRRLRGEPERVRTYRLRRVRGWLAGLGFQVMAEAGLVLPPRRRPGLARLLDARPVAWTLNAVPGLAALAAHSVLFVCRRGAPAGVPA
jgi:SAM-dependent methyltransferase